MTSSLRRNLSLLGCSRGGAGFKILLFFVVLGALLALAWMLFLPALVRSTLSKRTGFPIELTQFMANPFTGKIQFSGCRVRNPSDWPAPLFVEIREFRAETDLTSLLSDRIVIDDAYIDVAEVAVVTGTGGKTNSQLFKERLTGKTKEAKVRKDPKEAPPAPKAFLIRRLQLRVDKVTLANYAGSTPSVRTLDLEVDKTFTDVTSAKQVVSDAIPGIDAVGIALGGLLPGKLGEALTDVTHSTGTVLRKAGEAVKGLMEKLEEKPKP